MEIEKKYQNKEWLIKKYWDEKMSAYQIGKLCGTYGQIIQNWLIKYNISRRTIYENTNHCNLSQKAIEWINGELLGDGSLRFVSKQSAKFMYGSKHLEYIQYISDTLKSFGIEQSGKIRERIDKKYKSQSWQYESLSYSELLSIRKKWYPEGEKIVPKDIKLSPITCRQWHIGDGSLLHPKKSKPYIVLATNSFSILDIEWLRIQLINIGIKATSRKSTSGETIYISVYSIKDFLDYIGECPVECYKYKFNY